MELEKINKIVLISISTVITILLFICSVSAFFVLPDYANLFLEMGNDIPVETKLILDNYKYFIAVPIVSSIALFYLVKANKIKYQYLIFSIPVLTLVIGAVIFSMTVYAIYLPVTQGV